MSAVLLFAGYSLAFAQDEEEQEIPKKKTAPKGFLSASYGPSTTVGDFSNSDWFNEQAGFAKKGTNYAVEFGFKFIPNFGLSGAVKGAVIEMNVQALADGYAREYGGQFTVKSTRMTYTGFFVGPFISIPTKYVDIDFKFATGLLVAVSPDVTVNRDMETASQESATGGSLAFDGGAGLRIHLTKKFGLTTAAEFHVSRPTFQITYTDTNHQQEIVDSAQLITMFNFSFGIVYRLF